MGFVIVTGCAGFIGMHVCISFLKQGYSVIGIDNVNDYYDVSLKEARLSQIDNTALELSGVRWFFRRNDINDEALWEGLDSFRIDGIIHLAAQAGVRHSIDFPRDYLVSNINGFQSVIEFALSRKVERLLYASSSSVYGKSIMQPFGETQECNMPESYYAATKKMNELMAGVYYRTRGLCSVGLRFFTVYGPWGRPDMAPMIFARAAQNSRQIKLFNYGNQKRDFTYIDDIVNGISLLYQSEKLFKGADIVNIGNGHPQSLMRFVELLEKWIGKPLPYKLEGPQIGDVEETFASLERIKSLVDYAPRTGLNEGIGKFVDWYKGFYEGNL